MTSAVIFEDFEAIEVQAEETTIFLRRFGSGPAVLLLHGFPQTHVMWRSVAPLLARHFAVICADLRGYGRSGCPASRSDHSPYAKRAMANDMVSVMTQLGFPRFSIAGHDRGGRVAYRLALDHPQRLERLAVLDIVPTADTWERADKTLAIAFWPWSLLAQPEPLPERLISAAPDAVVDDALGAWGSPAIAFGAEVRAAYIDALRDRARVHAICEEYRAAATLDHEHDLAHRLSGTRALERTRAVRQLVRRGRRSAGAVAGVGERRPRRRARCRSFLSGGNTGTNGGRIERLLRCDILKARLCRHGCC
jgi:haloacetate dehalogenase